jgi:hypothetical protein
LFKEFSPESILLHVEKACAFIYLRSPAEAQKAIKKLRHHLPANVGYGNKSKKVFLIIFTYFFLSFSFPFPFSFSFFLFLFLFPFFPFLCFACFMLKLTRTGGVANKLALPLQTLVD